MDVPAGLQDAGGVDDGIDARDAVHGPERFQIGRLGADGVADPRQVGGGVRQQHVSGDRGQAAADLPAEARGDGDGHDHHKERDGYRDDSHLLLETQTRGDEAFRLHEITRYADIIFKMLYMHSKWMCCRTEGNQFAVLWNKCMRRASNANG